MLLLALVALAAGCKEVPTQGAAPAPSRPCSAPQPVPTGPITISSGGLQRTYLLSVPSPPPTTPARLIVNLHGAGSNAQQQAVYSGLATKGPARGFVVVTPDATGQPQQWNVVGQTKADDVTFIHDLLTDVATARLRRHDPRVRDRHLEWRRDELVARLQGRRPVHARSLRSRAWSSFRSNVRDGSAR